MKLPTLFFALFLAISTPAQSQFPDTPAAHQFSAWLEAFNSGDRAKLLSYLEKNNPDRAKEIDGELGFRENTGGFDFKKSQESTPNRFTGIVKEKNSDQYASFEIEVEAIAPHKIVKFGLRAIPQPADFPIARLSEPEVLKALRAELEKSSSADTFSGTALIAKNGKPIFAEAYGQSDRAAKTPNKLSTKFRIGSMNKMFTATAILQLNQAGKLQLTDTIGKILPDYPNKNVASKVTIHHLLTHTGGTGDIFGPDFESHRLQLKTLNDYVALYGKRDLQFEPGSQWDYSNYGFLLLGVIIEKVSGQSYYNYVEQNIFKPAGMTSTASLAEDQSVPDRSTGYTKRGPGTPWASNVDTLPYRGTSAGGGYSTVEDLLRFANALTSLKLLDAPHFELLTTGKTDTPRGEKYAYGFQDQRINGVRCFGHGGGAPGMNGELTICPQSGYTIAVLANLDPPAASKMATFIANRLPAK
jgi:CubicO group peptidase (beta-lactamase class C family)